MNNIKNQIENAAIIRAFELFLADLNWTKSTILALIYKIQHSMDEGGYYDLTFSLEKWVTVGNRAVNTIHVYALIKNQSIKFIEQHQEFPATITFYVLSSPVDNICIDIHDEDGDNVFSASWSNLKIEFESVKSYPLT